MAESRRPLDKARGNRDSVAVAIAKNFEGDEALYRLFATTCRQQFALDAQTGDAACAAGDSPALRRLCHDLKSVLLVLGFPEQSALAANTEKAAEARQLSGMRDQWRRLRVSLLKLPPP